MITVDVITTEDDLKTAFEIRRDVFIVEQNVPAEEEYDEYEEESIHLLAKIDQKPCGTCRWRFTKEGVKLERFAVAQDGRNQGVGSSLVEACLNSITNHEKYSGQPPYLNAQLTAMPLYSKFGFEPVGDVFLECEIEHIKMIKK